ncbi:hypothetical protein [Pedobacter aquatilis]|uniref:hypothetical protein n=1 Tax=Pedobacter aquatilis TaxID=351343 RepID=UPI00293116C3|nr:hypothetical protein [Pedobacter aquatilis]
MRIEAMTRYNNINFYHLNGKPEKREELLKEPKQEKSQDKIQNKNIAQGQEMAM